MFTIKMESSWYNDSMTITQKLCKRCNTVKALEEFHVDRNAPTGRKYACKQCSLKQNNEWREADPQRWELAKQRRYKTLRAQRYGMDLGDYDKLYQDQQGKCKICDREKETLAVDHDHLSGEVRGLLCTQCNVALGLLQDSPEILLSAIKYLEKAGGS